MCESSSGPPPSDPLIMINAFYSDGGKAPAWSWCHKRCWVCLSVFMPVHSWNYYKINSIHFSRKPFKNTIEAFMGPKLIWGLPLFLLPASSILNILCSVCPLHLLCTHAHLSLCLLNALPEPLPSYVFISDLIHPQVKSWQLQFCLLSFL